MLVHFNHFTIFHIQGVHPSIKPQCLTELNNATNCCFCGEDFAPLGAFLRGENAALHLCAIIGTQVMALATVTIVVSWQTSEAGHLASTSIFQMLSKTRNWNPRMTPKILELSKYTHVIDWCIIIDCRWVGLSDWSSLRIVFVHRFCFLDDLSDAFRHQTWDFPIQTCTNSNSTCWSSS